MKSLKGKVAIVTGAAGGLGKVICKELADQGAKVYVTDMSLSQSTKVAKSLKGKTVGYKLDVTNEDDWKDLIRAISKKDKKIDILVNNAGLKCKGRIKDLTAKDYLKAFKVNAIGPALGLKHVCKAMKKEKKGSVINIAGAAEKLHVSGRAGSTCTKSALVTISKTAAIEYLQDNIRVNTVSPGPMSNHLKDQSKKSIEDRKKSLKKRGLSCRLTSAKSVAKVVYFLSSDDSRGVNGAHISVDNSLTAGTHTLKEQMD